MGELPACLIPLLLTQYSAGPQSPNPPTPRPHKIVMLWMQSTIFLDKNTYTCSYCLMENVPIAGCLTHLILLGGGDSGRPLGTGGYPPGILHRAAFDHPEPGDQEHPSSTRWPSSGNHQGPEPSTEGCCCTDPSKPGEGQVHVLQRLLPSTQKGWWTQVHLEPEVLQPQCTKDPVQDRETATHRCSHAPHQSLSNVDQKDAYFHIKVEALHHSVRFPRFHWLSQSYQFGIPPLQAIITSSTFSATSSNGGTM